MKTAALLAVLALATSSCGDRDGPRETARQQPAKAKAPSALRSSKPAASQQLQSRVFDPSKATPDELAARQRLEQRLAEAAVEKEKRDAARARERARRLAQMTEQMATRLSESDANGDGLLSKDEAAEGPLGRRFAEIDTNSDGQLDATEQEAMIASLSERINESGLRGDRRGGNRGGRNRDGGGGRNGRGRDRN